MKKETYAFILLSFACQTLALHVTKRNEAPTQVPEAVAPTQAPTNPWNTVEQSMTNYGSAMDSVVKSQYPVTDAFEYMNRKMAELSGVSAAATKAPDTNAVTVSATHAKGTMAKEVENPDSASVPIAPGLADWDKLVNGPNPLGELNKIMNPFAPTPTSAPEEAAPPAPPMSPQEQKKHDWEEQHAKQMAEAEQRKLAWEAEQTKKKADQEAALQAIKDEQAQKKAAFEAEQAQKKADQEAALQAIKDEQAKKQAEWDAKYGANKGQAGTTKSDKDETKADTGSVSAVPVSAVPGFPVDKNTKAIWDQMSKVFR